MRSNNTHIPDNWVILKIDSSEVNEPFYKVLAGWSGGYLDSDSWRMNSGIEKIEIDGDYYKFIGSSGSVYKCHKEAEMVRMNIGGVLQQLQEQYPDVVSLVNFEDIKDEISS